LFQSELTLSFPSRIHWA